jgi:hypothetical protein
MGGAIAIVTHDWHGYVTRSIPDPSGHGLVNALDFCAGPYQFRSINAYLTPKSSATPGPATIYSRLTGYIQGATAPKWAQRLSPIDYQYGYIQRLIGQAARDGWFTVVNGDLNRTILQSAISTRSAINQWRDNNHLQAPMEHTLHYLPDYHTWQSPTLAQSNTIIDHCFHTPLPPNVHLHQVGTVHDEITNTLSDHHPVWLALALTDPFLIPPPYTPLPTLSRPDLDMTNDDELEQYNSCLTTRIERSLSKRFRSQTATGEARVSSHASGSGLAVLLTHSVLSVHEKKNGLDKAVKSVINHKCHLHRGRYKNCFSPHMRELQVYLYFYNNMLRIAFPAGRKRWSDPWTADNYQRILTSSLRQWTKRHDKILRRITPLSPVTQLPSPSHLEQKSFLSISRDSIQEQIRLIKSRLHATQREAMRDRTNPAIRRIDKMRRNKDLAGIIQSLCGTQQSALDLQTLPSADCGQITDPPQVHEALKTKFHDWHAIPTTLDPAADHVARNPRYWEHLLYYTDTGKPQRLLKTSKIPLPLQDSLKRVCAMKVTPAFTADLQAHLHERVTFEEFNESLNGIVNGGAPGPSETTNNMIKAWSPTNRRLAYRHMENIWKHRDAPKWFKDKLIKLAPKASGNPSLDNMRPISLYEVLRKAWTTIIAKRIHLAWHNNDILHPAQYGYRLDQSTQTALFSVLNELEGAHHNKDTKHITFWDIKRAFDSIPRNIQKLAWVRLGVPKDVAEWFVELDDHGLSYISSPHYHHSKNLNTPEGMAGRNEHFSQAPDLAYQAQRGIGQGESASSLMWTALYDILLEFIDPNNRYLHVAETHLDYSDEDALLAKPSAYADDLATATAGPNGEYMQQVQATWLSAFCAFSGLVMHPAKIKPTVIGPVPPKYNSLPTIGPLPYCDKTDLIIHDHQWTPISCPILPHLATIRYLGVDLELRPTAHSPSHQATLATINLHLSHILVQPGSPGAKIDYIQFKLMPIVMSTASCANWTLAQYRALDSPFSRAYRMLLALPAKSPEHILYAPKKLMGVGLPRFSDKAQIMKWEALIRSHAVGGHPADSVDSFFHRLPTTASFTVDLLETLTLPTDASNTVKWPKRHYVARSLLEWFHESGLSICRQHPDPRPREDQPRTNLSIADLAEHMLLWPNDLYDDEDNANLPPIRLVATDGSFTTHPRGTYDILASEHDLQTCGSGGGSAVFVPPGYHQDTHPPPLAIQFQLLREAQGMTAYIWELVSQAITLQFTKYLPPLELVLTSDCMGAIARTNQSLRTRHNQLANERGGCLAAGAHQFANPTYPQRFIHTYGHPERYEHRRTAPTLRDKAICMADAAAAGKDTAKLGQQTYPMDRHRIQLDNIFNELIPAGHWHLRTLEDKPYPVLNDILPFQHEAQQRIYCAKRDARNSERRWSSTSFAFAHSVHPLRDNSYWTAGRRALVAYDWIGHGRNRAKPDHLTPEDRAATSKCHLCQQQDSQAHCMLDCPHPQICDVRTEARSEQGEVVLALLAKYGRNQNQRHLIIQFAHACWTPSADTARLWLGLWTRRTLRTMLKQHLSAPLSMSQRREYIKIVKKLTAPLIDAYHTIQNIQVHHTHTHTHIHDPTAITPHVPIPSNLRHILESTFIQDDRLSTTSHLNSLDHIASHDAFHLSDAGFAYQTPDGTV